MRNLPPIKPRYRFAGFHKMARPRRLSDGYPAVAPPWGTLSAIDLNIGNYVWIVPLGVYSELAAPRTDGKWGADSHKTGTITG